MSFSFSNTFKFFSYKPDQGRFTRGVAFWLLTALSYFGCKTLYFFLHWDWAKQNLLGQNIPILNIPLSPGLIVSVGVFIAGEILISRLIVNRPKMCDLLIETETEMKKVTWPSWNDALNSSIVVLFTVIFFMILLGFSDFLLTKIFSGFIFSGGGG